MRYTNVIHMVIYFLSLSSVIQLVNRSGNKFADVWSGGITGITKKEQANERWWVTIHDRAAIADRTYEIFGMGEQVEAQHNEMSKKRATKDEQVVQALMDVMNTHISNPFANEGYDGHLTYIATGLLLPDSNANNLIEARH